MSNACPGQTPQTARAAQTARSASRFVVLEHDHPFPHWDLMLERGGVLQTWRLHKQPDFDGPISTETLADHRIEYLDYEGPVSGGRGTVRRWDRGEYTVVEETASKRIVRIIGDRLRGTAVLQDDRFCLRDLA